MTLQHLVLTTYGEPPLPGFTDQLVYSWRILQGLTRTVADIPQVAIPFIALARAHGRQRMWKENDYMSPLEPITEAQAAAVRDALAQSAPGDWRVHIAYEFRRPLLQDVLRTIADDDPVWIAPMYAADSAFTHELSRQAAAAPTGRSARRGRTEVLPALDLDHLADISAAHVLSQLGEGDTGPATALVLAAHGTLLEPARPIDTGRCATERLYGAIRTRLSAHFGLILNGWLNHTRGGRWTEPPIDMTLERVSQAGFTNVVYYPFGFLADNAESQLEGQLAAGARPELQIRFLPCLNDSEALAAALAKQVVAQ
ncbi:MAG: ferrochelatase [Acidobacteriota bacterium]|nr:ferrochelatase [Acidobacteriota bacterium]